ncbi:MAG: hypothetical protein ACFFBD_28150, partial [Candidatus Hodarchaeota archaeon]
MNNFLHLNKQNIYRIALEFVTLTKNIEKKFALNKDILAKLRNFIPIPLSSDQLSGFVGQTIILRKFLSFLFNKSPYLPPSFMGIFKEIEKEYSPALNILDDFIREISLKFSLKSLEHSTFEFWIYFYECYLSALNPGLQKQRGVFYTPLPVVRFILRAVNTLLKKELKFNGLLDPQVKVLDPSAGIMPFYLILLKDFGSEFSPQLLFKLVTSNLLAFEIIPATYLFSYM